MCQRTWIETELRKKKKVNINKDNVYRSLQ